MIGLWVFAVKFVVLGQRAHLMADLPLSMAAAGWLIPVCPLRPGFDAHEETRRHSQVASAGG